MLKTLLLVDDDKDDRELFREALDEIAPEVALLMSEDATQAMKELQGGNRLPDLIFLDINLPVTSGWELLTRIKGLERLRDIPVIIYSTSSHARERQIADDLGALCFITKPQSFSALKKLLVSTLLCMRTNEPQLIRDYIADTIKKGS